MQYMRKTIGPELLCAARLSTASGAPQAEFEAEFDHTPAGASTSRWDMEGGYGTERHKLWLLSEGDYSDGSGLSESELGLRGLYTLRPGVMPYAEFSYTRLAGETADIARAAGASADTSRLWLGLKIEY
jgi:uncharacterized protein involved in copper resistance